MEDNSYYLLNDEEFKFINKIADLNMTNYELKGNFIPVSSLLSMIYDLYYEYEHKCEELEDLQKDIEENYTLNNFDAYDYYGVSRRDFA